MSRFDGLAKKLDTASGNDAPKRHSSSVLQRGIGSSEKMDRARPYEHEIKYLRPDQCMIWDAPDRDLNDLRERDVADLIESIRTLGRVERPLVARAKRVEGETLYEIIQGRRRFFAVRLLHEKYGKTDILLPVEVRKKLSDIEAFLSSEAENRGRAELCDYHRGKKYAHAVETFYASQSELAQAIGLGKSTISRLIRLSRAPEDLIGAFPSVLEISEKALRPLLVKMDADPKIQKKVIAEAKRLIEEQVERSQTDKAPLPSSFVLQHLKQAAEPKKKPKAQPTTKLIKIDGTPAFSIAPKRGTKIAIEMISPSEETLDAVLKELKAQILQRMS